MKVTAIIQRVRNLLQDNTPVPRWTNSDLLDCYNEALLAVILPQFRTFYEKTAPDWKTVICCPLTFLLEPLTTIATFRPRHCTLPRSLTRM
ncbi:DUF6682 family protein [Endozoicomonas sp. ONNA2]|uniref:DUF6682 family protein n=1 Tax=Endozoicomonas sp. ONNA2 TaxID=2828741 RepID=UPI0021498D4C|nr:DUF6682 family protein [Endozoicomonas sp. ONNA2]